MLHLHRFHSEISTKCTTPLFPLSSLQRRIIIVPLKKRFRFINATIELQRFFFLFLPIQRRDTNDRRQSSAENNPILTRLLHTSRKFTGFVPGGGRG